MTNDVDAHLLRMNVVECLLSYLEGRIELPAVLQLGERLQQREPQTLSEPMRMAVADLQQLNQRAGEGKELDEGTVTDAVNTALLRLTIEQLFVSR